MVGKVCRFKQHHEAVCAELNGEVALFQSSTCDYLVLNETGSAIWNALKARPTFLEICNHLLAQYEVTPDECRTCVEAWLVAALEKKVVAEVDD